MLNISTLSDKLDRFADQTTLFAARPARLALQSLKANRPTARDVRINVWRNHAFEPLVPLIRPYAAFGGWSPVFQLGGYDDSLTFAAPHPADAELVWLDLDRLRTGGDLLPWLHERLAALRALSSAPIVLATWCRDSREAADVLRMVDGMTSTYFADLGAEAAEGGVQLLDARSSGVAGTPLGATAQVLIARKLACHWLAAAVLPPIKALALDLDNTLHSGVLGEDGAEGVHLTAAHAELQQYARELRSRGVFVALVSRNDEADVVSLFAKRSDYPLRWDDFSVTEVSWDDKADAVSRVAQALRIGTDAVLFVDDNVGELASVGLKAPLVHILHAGTDLQLTRRAIHFYPGLWRWKTAGEDDKRLHDVKANIEREALARTATDPVEYFRSLQITLRFRNDAADQTRRLGDLCKKTNQFNLALRRFTEVEVAQRIADASACVASVALQDRLSDSGVIAVIVAERHGVRVIIEELCISCRALGRNLENAIVVAAVRTMPIFTDCEEVAFRVAPGPRNQPALDWLGALLGVSATLEPGLYAVPAQAVQSLEAGAGVNLIFE